MKNEREKFGKLLDILDQTMTKLGSMHPPPHDFGAGVPLYRSEIHTIRAIGENPEVNVTKLAEDMGVTKGAVSQTITKLVKKGLVRKTYAADNAKEVRLELTELGWSGFYSHQKLHMDMFDTAKEYFGDEFNTNLDAFIKVMGDLKEILAKYEHKKKFV